MKLAKVIAIELALVVFLATAIVMVFSAWQWAWPLACVCGIVAFFLFKKLPR